MKPEKETLQTAQQQPSKKPKPRSPRANKKKTTPKK